MREGLKPRRCQKHAGQASVLHGRSIGGVAEVWLTRTDGTRQFVGRFHNVVTNQARERLLRTLFQTTSGDKVSATAYMKKVAFCSDALPSEPEHDAISGVEGYEDVSTISDVSSTASSTSGTITASWTNSGMSAVTIKYVALCYAASTAATNVYAVLGIDETTVGIGDTLDVTYICQFNFGTYNQPIV